MPGRRLMATLDFAIGTFSNSKNEIRRVINNVPLMIMSAAQRTIIVKLRWNLSIASWLRPHRMLKVKRRNFLVP